MNYIVDENGSHAHYFYHHTDGICRNYLRYGIKQEKRIIYKDAADVYGLYPDGVNIHIITISKTNELIYLKGYANNWRRYILRKLRNDEKILRIELYSVKSRLHMLYTVMINNKILLASCMLGNDCMPCAIAEPSTGYFNIINNIVYFKSLSGDSFSYDLSGHDNVICSKIAENSDTPYTLNKHIAFISDGKIFFDYKELCRDENAENLILTESKNTLYAIWKSNDGIRYINTDMSEKTPHNILIPAGKFILYTVFTHGKRLLAYGNSSDSELKIYLNSSFFSAKNQEHTDSLKEKLESIKNEIELLRNQLASFSNQLK